MLTRAVCSIGNIGTNFVPIFPRGDYLQLAESNSLVCFEEDFNFIQSLFFQFKLNQVRVYLAPGYQALIVILSMGSGCP